MMNPSSVPAGFPYRIGRSLSAGFALIIAAILLLGGVSVLLASRIYRNQDAVAQEYLHILLLDSIDVAFDNIVFELQERQINGRFERLENLEPMHAELMQHLEAFWRVHQARVGSAWKNNERAAFADLQQMAEELRALTRRMLASSAGSRRLVLRDLDRLRFVFRQVPGKVEDLTDLHRTRITELLERSQGMLQDIVALYLIFIPIGGALIVVTSMIFRRRVAMPLRTLSDAALGIAEGRRDQRVQIRSRDEFGQVSQAFNIMAERVDTREREIADLHMGLQDRVLERTRELEETMRSLVSAQEALVRSERLMVVGQTATAVTHGIRTPLSALAINLQLLRRALDRQTFSPEQVRDLLSTADLEVDRINRTLEEFYRYARLPKPRYTPVDCNALVRQIAAFLQGQAEAARVRITLTLADGLPSIQADGDQLREVLVNLTSNAIDAMPDGGNLTIETHRIEDAGTQGVLARVSDSGPGIPPETLPHIFEAFFSTKSRGLGLGLPIALRIAEEHGGTIRCQSREGEGTSFEVILPLTPPVRTSHNGDTET